MGKFTAQDVLDGKCLVHGVHMLPTTSYDYRGVPVRTFLSCPLCATEVIDKLAREPGVITITNDTSST